MRPRYNRVHLTFGGRDFPGLFLPYFTAAKDPQGQHGNSQGRSGGQGELNREQSLTAPVDVLHVEQQGRLVEGQAHADAKCSGDPAIGLVPVQEQRRDSGTESDHDPGNEVMDVPATHTDIPERAPVFPDRPGGEADRRETAEETGQQVEENKLAAGRGRVALDGDPERVGGRGRSGIDQTLSLDRMGTTAKQACVLGGNHSSGDRHGPDREGGGCPVTLDRLPVRMLLPRANQLRGGI